LSVSSDSDAEDSEPEMEERRAEKVVKKKVAKRSKQVPVESEDDEQEMEERRAAKVVKKKGTKRPKQDPAESGEDEATVSESEISQKRFKVVKKKATGPKPGKKEKPKVMRASKKGFKTITKNYAPDESPDDQNKYYFRAFIGGGFYVSLAKWIRNNQKYIQIRKSATSGANIPLAQFKYLKEAIEDMEKDCSNLIYAKPASDESD